MIIRGLVWAENGSLLLSQRLCLREGIVIKDDKYYVIVVMQLVGIQKTQYH